MAIAAALPPLKDLTFQVNRLLQQLHKRDDECNGFILPEICRFKAGDDWKSVKYEPYPEKISYETIGRPWWLHFCGNRAGPRLPRYNF